MKQEKTVGTGTCFITIWMALVLQHQLIQIAMKIPDVVLQEASETMEQLEGTLVYLGKIGDGRSSDVTFLPNNLHLSEIIRKFATEKMA